MKLVLFFIALLPAWQQTGAADFRLSQNTQIVGESQSIVARHSDSLYSIALKHRLGAAAIVRANPDISAELPGVGVTVQLPSEHILPNAEREGIVINLPEMRLYYFAPDGKTVSVYPVGIGRQGWETPLLQSAITSVVREPNWIPPQSIRKEYQASGMELPASVPAGPNNPLGKYALRIGHSSYLIHGTNKPEGVGLRVSHGCIRLYPEHIEELASGIATGAPVRIISEPIKLARRKGKQGPGSWVVQAFRPLSRGPSNRAAEIRTFIQRAETLLNDDEIAVLKTTMQNAIHEGVFYTGIPLPVPNTEVLSNIVEDDR